MFDGPAADMTALPPPGAAPDHRGRRLHPSGVSYADDAPIMPMPPGAMSEDSRSHDSASPSTGGVSFGSDGPGGNTADITPRPSIPDTEVSYGKNGGN